MDNSLKIILLRQIFWDYKLSGEEITLLLHEHALPDKGISTMNYYRRLLSSYNWYTLKNILSESELKQAVSDKNLAGLFPKKLAENYRYVRRFL